MSNKKKFRFTVISLAMILMLTACTKIAVDPNPTVEVTHSIRIDLGEIIYCALVEFMQSPLSVICLIIIAGSLMSIAGSLFDLSKAYKQISKNTSSAESVMKFMQNR